MPDTLSHYMLVEKVGTGGMGTVYRAEDQMTGGTVAVKTLHPHLAADAEYLRRFEAEARIAQSIDSPHVVKVLDHGHDGDTYFLVMEFVPGQSLAEVIQKRGALPLDEAVAIATAIARALAAANDRAIVHRDISPQNVLITPNGTAKVTDFGISRDLTQNTMTATSMLMGKPLYLAPEVASGTSKADIRSDIYALGVVLFQMLAGRVPFDADTPFAVMQRHVSTPAPDLGDFRAGVPSWLCGLVDACLAKEPGHRPQTPHAVITAIDAKEDSTVRVTREATEQTHRRNDLETVRERTPERGALGHGPPPSLTLELRKLRDSLDGKPAEFNLMLRNPSQRAVSVRLDGYDAQNLLQFDMPRVWNLPPGAENSVYVKTMPRHKRLFGGKRGHTFTVRAAGDGNDKTPPITTTGSFEEGPPAWPLMSAIAALALVIAVGVGTAVAMSGGDRNNAGGDRQAGILASREVAAAVPPTAVPTAVPNTPTPVLPAFTAAWAEPRPNQALNGGQVFFRASYGVGSDRRAVARVDFNVYANGWYRACSAFAPNGPALAMPGAPLSAVYFYECSADLSGGPFGLVSFAFDLTYTDGTPVYAAGGELKATRQAPPPPTPLPPPTPTTVRPAPAATPPPPQTQPESPPPAPAPVTTPPPPPFGVAVQGGQGPCSQPGGSGSVSITVALSSCRVSCNSYLSPVTLTITIMQNQSPAPDGTRVSVIANPGTVTPSDLTTRGGVVTASFSQTAGGGGFGNIFVSALGASGALAYTTTCP